MVQKMIFLGHVLMQGLQKDQPNPKRIKLCSIVLIKTTSIVSLCVQLKF